MYLLKQTTITKDFLSQIISNPVLSAIVSEYAFDNDYIYIPESKLKDQDLVDGLVEKGFLIKKDKDFIIPQK